MLILYDGRAKNPDMEHDATIMDTADDEQEATEAGKTAWKDHDVIWYDDNGPRWDIPPNKMDL